MKKILTLVLLTLSFSAFAHGPYGYHGYHRGGSGWWIGPAVVGIIGYEIGRQQQVIVQQQPVIVQQPPVVWQPKENCGPWTETLNSDGTITRTRTCTQ